MPDVDDRLRLLARWHARRRAVDDLLEPLLQHGPAAVERVTARLDDLSGALAAEGLAFEAFVAAARADPTDPAGPPDPTGLPEPRPSRPPVVDEVGLARHRAQQGRHSSYPDLTDRLDDERERPSVVHLPDHDSYSRSPCGKPVLSPVEDL